MDELNTLKLNYSTTKFPLEYKLFEWRLIINRELYEEHIIDLKIFTTMENFLLTRMKKLENDISRTRE